MNDGGVEACGLSPHHHSFSALLPSGGSSQFPDATVEIHILSLFSGPAAFFTHLREMVYAILCHIGCSTFRGNGAVVFATAFLLECCSSLFSDASKVVFTILIADRASPFTARLRG